MNQTTKLKSLFDQKNNTPNIYDYLDGYPLFKNNWTQGKNIKAYFNKEEFFKRIEKLVELLEKNKISKDKVDIVKGIIEYSKRIKNTVQGNLRSNKRMYDFMKLMLEPKELILQDDIKEEEEKVSKHINSSENQIIELIQSLNLNLNKKEIKGIIERIENNINLEIYIENINSNKTIDLNLSLVSNAISSLKLDKFYIIQKLKEKGLKLSFINRIIHSRGSQKIYNKQLTKLIEFIFEEKLNIR